MAKLPSNLEELSSNTSQVVSLTRSKQKDTISLLDSALNLYSQGLLLMKPKSNSESEWVIWGLTAKTFNTLKCIHDLLLGGYYPQALDLTRTALEDYVGCEYITAHPDEAKRWMREGLRPPKFGVMRRKLPAELEKHIGELYGVLNSFSHTNRAGILYSTAERKGEVIFAIGGRYDEMLFDDVVYKALVVFPSMLVIVGRYIEPANGWHSSVRPLMDKMQSWIRTVNERLFKEGF